jgi:hypothetical protein
MPSSNETFPSLFRLRANWVRSSSYARISMKDTAGISMTGRACAIVSMRSGSSRERQGLALLTTTTIFEFLPIDGRIPYDVTLAETDPELVKLEIDVYWTARAKRDPVAYFQKYPKRFPLVHLKDMAHDGTITDIGKGIIDFKRILADSALAGMAYCFVEHDNPCNPMLSIETSLRFVRQLGI